MPYALTGITTAPAINTGDETMSAVLYVLGLGFCLGYFIGLWACGRQFFDSKHNPEATGRSPGEHLIEPEDNQKKPKEKPNEDNH
jgi:hypothetical protein